MEILKKLNNLVDFANDEDCVLTIAITYKRLKINLVGAMNCLIDNNTFMCNGEPISFMDGDSLAVDVNDICDLRFDDSQNTFVMSIHNATICFQKM